MWVSDIRSYDFYSEQIIYSYTSIYLASKPLKQSTLRIRHTNYLKYATTYFVTSAPLTRNHIRIGTHRAQHIISRKVNTRVRTSARAHTNCAGPLYTTELPGGARHTEPRTEWKWLRDQLEWVGGGAIVELIRCLNCITTDKSDDCVRMLFRHPFVTAGAGFNI